MSLSESNNTGENHREELNPRRIFPSTTRFTLKLKTSTKLKGGQVERPGNVTDAGHWLGIDNRRVLDGFFVVTPPLDEEVADTDEDRGEDHDQEHGRRGIPEGTHEPHVTSAWEI